MEFKNGDTMYAALKKKSVSREEKMCEIAQAELGHGGKTQICSEVY